MIRKAELWLNLILACLHPWVIQRGLYLPTFPHAIQGTVTEDKNNASHVVYPVPGNLEEGETWVVLASAVLGLGVGDSSAPAQCLGSSSLLSTLSPPTALCPYFRVPGWSTSCKRLFSVYPFSLSLSLFCLYPQRNGYDQSWSGISRFFCTGATILTGEDRALGQV